ncbi:MAG TPA: hypothetical protein VFI31_19320 [Pirellulales bacterium]|nr:hypothetical protein [Pirellulales bacterium]
MLLRLARLLLDGTIVLPRRRRQELLRRKQGMLRQDRQIVTRSFVPTNDGG